MMGKTNHISGSGSFRRIQFESPSLELATITSTKCAQVSSGKVSQTHGHILDDSGHISSFASHYSELIFDNEKVKTITPCIKKV